MQSSVLLLQIPSPCATANKRILLQPASWSNAISVRAQQINTSCMLLILNTVITQILTIAFWSCYRTFFSTTQSPIPLRYHWILLHSNYFTTAYQEVPLPHFIQFFLTCNQSQHTSPSCLTPTSSFSLSHSGAPDPVRLMSKAILQGICSWFDERSVQHRLF